MTIAIRRLDPTTDQAFYRWAFSWLADSPLWRQHTEAVFGTLDQAEYLQAARSDRSRRPVEPGSDRRLDIGVMDGPVFVAKVALHLTAKHTYEVSLEAARGVNPAAIITAGLLIRDRLFGEYHARSVFAWVPRWASGVRRVLAAIGFHNSCVSMLRGTCRGRTIEWLRFSLEVDR